MRARALILLPLWMASISFACKDDGSTDIPGETNVAGKWLGTLDNMTIQLNLTQVHFEGSIAVSGIASLTKDTLAVSYAVMNGGHNGVDKIYFSLYRIPVTTKEEYHICGSMSPTLLHGSFDCFDQSGTVLSTGTWQVQKAP